MLYVNEYEMCICNKQADTVRMNRIEITDENR